jgi:hypothetical protein
MADLINYCKTIQHATARCGNREEAVCKAILFDINDNGFVKSLNKNYNNDGQVDYIEMIGDEVILLELKDLKEKLTHTSASDILINLTNKYNVSISIIKDYINQNCIPVSYYVVVQNNTDIVTLDNLFPIREVKKNLSLKGNFIVCKTNEICKKLSTLNTRLCQE